MVDPGDIAALEALYAAVSLCALRRFSRHPNQSRVFLPVKVSMVPNSVAISVV